MRQAVDSVLAERRRVGLRRRKGGLFSSIFVHGGIIAFFLIAPLLSAGDSEPLEFVDVQIVPIQALGIPDPPASSPAPRAAEPEVVLPDEPEVSEPEPSLPTPEPVEQPKPRNDVTPREPAPRTSTPDSRSTGSSSQRQGSPLGSPTGTSPFGATAVAGLDNPDFTYGYYVDQMLAMIGTQWVRPALGSGVEAILHFQIERDGRVTDLRVVQSSGYNSFDLAGIRAVQTASPLPPLPTSYRRGTLGVTLIVR